MLKMDAVKNSDDRLVASAVRYIKNLFESDHSGHDAAHTLRVCHNALRICEGEGACDVQLVALAALLHDADDPKLFDTRDYANARSFLASQGQDEERIQQVIDIVSAVSFSKNRLNPPATPEGKIVQDADRLDAIGAVGVARTFAYGGAHGRSLEASIAHFHEKLLLLKDGLNTATAKKLAAGRHQFLLSFLAQWQIETGEDG